MRKNSDFIDTNYNVITRYDSREGILLCSQSETYATLSGVNDSTVVLSDEGVAQNPRGTSEPFKALKAQTALP